MAGRYKFIAILFFGLMGLSLTIRNQPPKIDLKNMARVETSTYIMGTDSTRLRILVPAFYIDKYEVTNAEFKKFIDANPQWSKSNIPDSLQDCNYLKDWKGNKYPKARADYPVVYVSWYAAGAYAKWKGKRLPVEPEWESAAKGIDKSSEFPWGNIDADATKANYLESHTGHAVKTGSYAPNKLGLYDMAGNVKEFCLDHWNSWNAKRTNFKKNSSLISSPKSYNHFIVIKGGAWDSESVGLRTTFLESYPVNKCSDDVGFRCAASMPLNK